MPARKQKKKPARDRALVDVLIRGIGDYVTLCEDCLAEELFELVPQKSSLVLKIRRLWQDNIDDEDECERCLEAPVAGKYFAAWYEKMPTKEEDERKEAEWREAVKKDPSILTNEESRLGFDPKNLWKED